MLSLLSLSLFAVAAPAPAPKVPIGPAPRVEVVQVEEGGQPVLVFIQISYTTVTKQGVTTVEGKQVPFTYEESVPVGVSRKILLDTKDVQVSGSDSKRVEPGEVRKVLSQSTKVLLSTDGKPIHPSHLERHREITYSVVVPSLAPAPVEAATPEVIPNPRAEPIKALPMQSKEK